MPRPSPVALLLTVAALAATVIAATPPPPVPSPPSVQPAPTTADELPIPDDPASSAGPPLAADGDLATLFTPPPVEQPAGTLRHSPYDRPEWARTFDLEAAPEWQFVPAPAPDLFVAEPDYGDVNAGMVHVASAILGRTTPWELTRKQARRLVRRAGDEAAVLSTLTRTQFTRKGLLVASKRLGEPADTLWDLDVGVLASAAAGSLERALATWNVTVEQPGDVGSVTRALRRAQRRAELPAVVNAHNLSRLSTRSSVARADGASQDGVTLHLGRPQKVAGLLQRRAVTARLPDGATTRGQLLVWHPDDPNLDLRTDLAAGWGGRASVPHAAARLGAVAAVNGGFWLDASEPDGLLVTDGRMRSDATAWTGTQRGVRGAFGITGDTVRVDKPDWQIELRRGTTRVGVDALNRPARPGQTVAWNNDGPAPTGAAGTWWRVPDVGHSGRAVRLPGPAIPGPDDLVVATPLDLSGRWTTSITATDGWADLDDALAGGPRLLFDGRRTPEGWWIGEGFAPAHTHLRHPRTAVGVDPYGGLVVLVLDGRQPGWSDGATQSETQSIMLALGVEDATMLDGGGSSQLVANGVLRNRPCCDRPPRAVATVAAFVPARD